MYVKAAPTFAMEGPDRIVVWQDHEGKIWFAYKSAEWLQKTYARHGIAIPKSNIEFYRRLLNELALKATQ
jgi:uncharacterized protein (DUF302 family)